jgi:hypothetical protein
MTMIYASEVRELRRLAYLENDDTLVKYANWALSEPRGSGNRQLGAVECAAAWQKRFGWLTDVVVRKLQAAALWEDDASLAASCQAVLDKLRDIDGSLLYPGAWDRCARVWIERYGADGSNITDAMIRGLVDGDVTKEVAIACEMALRAQPDELTDESYYAWRHDRDVARDVCATAWNERRRAQRTLQPVAQAKTGAPSMTPWTRERLDAVIRAVSAQLERLGGGPRIRNEHVDLEAGLARLREERDRLEPPGDKS